MTEVVIGCEIVRFLILQQLNPFPLDGKLELVDCVNYQEQLQEDVKDGAKISFELCRSQAIYRENKLVPKRIKSVAKRCSAFTNIWNGC